MAVIRTRFAPSPTGFMHIGNLRTALYEYLIARSKGGQFILRIEDTDQGRYVEGAMDAVLETLRMTGITYDEGPGVGGDYGPYIQSERKAIYLEYAKQLVQRGAAYYCFCSKERLDALRTSEGVSFNYDRHCLGLPQEEIERNLAEGKPYVIRQLVPREGKTTFSDVVYGDITVDNDTLDDQILIKSDGLPTYNFANVIDDHLMKITHVVRGNEYLSSTPKYNILYQAFGWEIPVYIHLPSIMKDAHTKLSKRNGDASFQDLIQKGYLPEAILNYIALLGWSPGGTREFFTLKELEENFTIEGLNKSPSIFDIEKLRWMNAEYIRNSTPEQFRQLAQPYVEQALGEADLDTGKICALIQQRTEVLTEIPEKIVFFKELPEYDTAIYCNKKMKTDRVNSLENLRKVLQYFTDNENLLRAGWTSARLYEALCALAEQNGVKNSQILWPVRTALSGKEVSPGGATEIAEILGYGETMRRLAVGIKKLETEGTVENGSQQ